jgi:hypothetical protein
MFAFLSEALPVLLALGLVPAVVAFAKDRSFAPWWLYGTALIIIALPHSILLRSGAEPHIDEPDYPIPKTMSRPMA